MWESEITPIPHEDLRRLDVSGACNNLQYGLKHLWEKKHLRSQLRHGLKSYNNDNESL